MKHELGMKKRKEPKSTRGKGFKENSRKSRKSRKAQKEEEEEDDEEETRLRALLLCPLPADAAEDGPLL